jgi:hypothetical protein
MLCWRVLQNLLIHSHSVQNQLVTGTLHEKLHAPCNWVGSSSPKEFQQGKRQPKEFPSHSQKTKVTEFLQGKFSILKMSKVKFWQVH